MSKTDWLQVIIPLILVALLYAWGVAGVNRIIRNDQPSFAPHVPAECSWKEVERDGQWEQTCDDNQKRLQR